MSQKELDPYKKLEKDLDEAFQKINDGTSVKKEKKVEIPDDLDFETLIDWTVEDNPKPKRKTKK